MDELDDRPDALHGASEGRENRTEAQLGGLADQAAGLVAVLHAGQVDHDLVAVALDLGLGHAEAVDTVADDVDGLVESRCTQSQMSSSESDAGTLNGSRSIAFERRLRRDLERDPHAREHARAILLGRQEVAAHGRLRVGHRRAQAHLAARRRLDDHRPERVAVVGRRRQSLVEERRRGEVELDVRRRQVRARPEEAARLGVVRRQRPAALALEEREVLGREDPEETGLVGEVVDVDHAVVLQVLADRQVLSHGDPESRELVRRPDSREHEEHRRLVGAGCEDHLSLRPHGLALAVDDELDADRAVAVEDDPLDEDAGADLEVRPSRYRMQERVGRAAAHAVSLRELEARDALGAVDVQVVDVLVAGLDGRLELRLDERATSSGCRRRRAAHRRRGTRPRRARCPPSA